jgi:hypothetical protein
MLLLAFPRSRKICSARGISSMLVPPAAIHLNFNDFETVAIRALTREPMIFQQY